MTEQVIEKTKRTIKTKKKIQTRREKVSTKLANQEISLVYSKLLERNA